MSGNESNYESENDRDNDNANDNNVNVNNNDNQIVNSTDNENVNNNDNDGNGTDFWDILIYIFENEMTMNNAKKFALLLVIMVICFHFQFWNRNPRQSCYRMIGAGQIRSDDKFQPYGCMLHKYDFKDTYNCLEFYYKYYGYNKLLFMGDENIYIFYQYVRLFISQGRDKYPKQDGLTMTDLQFIRADYFNQNLKENITKHLEIAKDIPTVFIIGFDQHAYMARNHKNAYEFIENDLTALKKLFENKPAGTTALFSLYDPVDPKRFEGSYQLYNQHLEEMNALTYMILHDSNIVIWYTMWQISEHFVDKSNNGQVLSKEAVQQDTQILLNLYCNYDMNHTDGTCCSRIHTYSRIQITSHAFLHLFFVLAIVTMALNYLQYHNYLPTNVDRDMTTLTQFIAVGKLSLIMLYFLFCDRTNMFMEENKHFDMYYFIIPFIVVIVLGLKHIEKSPNMKILNKNQLNELKGFMILITLISDINGAERYLIVRMLIKLFVGSFLFFEGYTHMDDIMEVGRSTLAKFVHVIYHLNMFAVICCFCMRTSYQVYFYVPLLTVWLCVIYFVWALPPPIFTFTKSFRNKRYNYKCLVLKIVIMIFGTTVLYMSRPLFDEIFLTTPFKHLFVTRYGDGDGEYIDKWWHQWQLDRYTLIYGMIFAAFVHIAREKGLFNERNEYLFTNRLVIVSVFLCSIILFLYVYAFPDSCDNLKECNNIYSYIVFIPIISYIILRNISLKMRESYSKFFAWFGRISLELYLCRYHIFLKANGTGVLLFLHDNLIFNLAITGFIYICIAHELNYIRRILQPIIMPKDKSMMFLYLVGFLTVLIPVTLRTSSKNMGPRFYI